LIDDSQLRRQRADLERREKGAGPEVQPAIPARELAPVLEVASLETKSTASHVMHLLVSPEEAARRFGKVACGRLIHRGGGRTSARDVVTCPECLGRKP
jgi:hypothetical protein